MTDTKGLRQYHLLGRSGLRVSPLALGTMTFGTEWGWGSPRETAHEMLARYLDQGGNFIDTADGYTGGTSEALVGEYFLHAGGRDRAVIATKYTLGAVAGDPNSGGNGRKAMFGALEGSLRRLRTDYVDLYFLHAWDTMTPVEEVMGAFADLVRQGKVRYVGFSDVPAWYYARAQTLAGRDGLPPVIALQLEYSLVERNIEREHVPAALALGSALVGWSPLASGLLSGKYARAGTSARGPGRLESIQASGNPGFDKLFTERNWGIVETLGTVARELGRPPAQVALSWTLRRPGVGALILGATRPEQLAENLAALDLVLPESAARHLETASRPELVHPYHFFTEFFAAMRSGGAPVRAEPPWFRPPAPV
ncbi:MAG TPA: aldo/keto reductase [Anaeromyxobacter sp.]|nr:aldo/keto reductase [Anaeromyxobacter sp.]